MAVNRLMPGSEARIRIVGAGSEPLACVTDKRRQSGLQAVGGGRSHAGPLPDAMPGGMIGRCPAMERLFLQMRYLAGHLRIASIEGERGSGRRIVAETLHSLGPARDSAFLHEDAAHLMRGPELGRALARLGGGTLYLEQVDALDPAGQELLLRLLRWVRGSAGALEGIRASLVAGDPAPGHLSVAGPSQCDTPMSSSAASEEKPPRAVIVSSRRPLPLLAAQGRFRADLLQQLALVQLRIPPLRERGGDLALLAGVFAAEAAAQRDKEVKGFTVEAMDLLRGQLWPENVTELHLVIEDAVARAASLWVQGCDLRLPWSGRNAAQPEHGQTGASALDDSGGSGFTAPELSAARLVPLFVAAAGKRNLDLKAEQPREKKSARSRQMERFEPRPNARPDREDDPDLDRAILRHIRRVLASVRGNKLRAARLLGISRSTLYRLLEGSEEGVGE
jgi:DNA-binding NtrC family response regulator